MIQDDDIKVVEGNMHEIEFEDNLKRSFEMQYKNHVESKWEGAEGSLVFQYLVPNRNPNSQFQFEWQTYATPRGLPKSFMFDLIRRHIFNIRKITEVYFLYDTDVR